VQEVFTHKKLHSLVFCCISKFSNFRGKKKRIKAAVTAEQDVVVEEILVQAERHLWIDGFFGARNLPDA
jgi:hypothetical protein